MTRKARVMEWTRPTVRALKPYYSAPLQGNPLRLDQNTNLHGANPALAKVGIPDVTQYPSRDADDLLEALAKWHGLAPENFVVGNGSDEALDLLTKAFAAPGQRLVTPTPGYSLYPFYAQLQELKLHQVPLKGSFQLDLENMTPTDAAITIMATPNNPTGNRFSEADLEHILANASGVVVIDEAYIEYAGLAHSFASRVNDYDNLVVMRTFSKAYGLAGLRIGYMIANPELTERLRLVKPPFNLNAYAEAVAIAALDEQEWLDDVVQQVTDERERLAARLKERGMRPYASDANFILAETPDDPGVMLAQLRSKGILARTFPTVNGLQNTIRFTVGKPQHTDALLAALEDA